VEHPRTDTHRDRPRTQATAPDASQGGIQRASNEVAGGTSHQESTRRPPVSVDAPAPLTPRASSEESEEGNDAHGDRHHRKRKTIRGSPQADSFDHRRKDSGSTLSDGELSSETEFLISDQGGHNNRRPKRRIAETDVGASKWTLEEWRMLFTSVTLRSQATTTVSPKSARSLPSPKPSGRPLTRSGPLLAAFVSSRTGRRKLPSEL
jgi:hypothetical protein